MAFFTLQSMQYAQQLKSERSGSSKVEVLDEGDEDVSYNTITINRYNHDI